MKFLAICFLGGMAGSNLLLAVALGSTLNLVVGCIAALVLCGLVLSELESPR